jgi:hypothetical protein
MAKKRRRKRKSRTSKIKLVKVETLAEQRKKLPKELIDAFINLDKTKVRGTEFDFEYYEWTEGAYKLYEIEAKKYLGENAEDRIESGKLIVALTRATMGIRDGKQQKSSKEKEKIRGSKTKREEA